MDREYELKIHRVIYRHMLFLKDRVEHFEDTETFWDETIKSADALSDGSDLSSDPYMLVMNELSRIARKGRG